MYQLSKVILALPNLAGLFIYNAPLLAGSVGAKARGVYIGGTEATCGNGPSYFAYLHNGLTTLLGYLRDGSETNTRTVHMNYCKPGETLAGNFNNSFPYSVSGYIVSSQNIFDGNIVRYEAGTYVELNNGFVSGTDFIAEINPCVSTITPIAAKTEDEVVEQNTITVNTENSIKIYPTIITSGNAINIQTSQATQTLQITIFDLQGKVVKQETLNEMLPNETRHVMLNSLSAGFYLVKAQNNYISVTTKIVVK